MKKLNSLKNKINNNSEFIFYNGQEAEEAFGLQTKSETRGMGEYARLLSLKLINSTDRVIVIDSADLIIKDDLLELYNYPLDVEVVLIQLFLVLKIFIITKKILLMEV
jgi:lipopolysaccharide biosynthesis glycosyltransferase